MTSTPIRIWHQSTTDLSRQRNYAAALLRQARAICASDTQIDFHGVAPGTYPQGLSAGHANRSPWTRYLTTLQVIECARAAEEGGYHAVAIGCFLDSGLEQARSAVGIPVVGLCESSLAASAAFGRRCGLICLDRPGIRARQDTIDRAGLAGRVAGIVGLAPPISGLELEAAFDDPAMLAERLENAARALVDMGADLVMPAEGILNTLLVHHGITSLGGAPVINPLALLFSYAEMAVRLGRQGGLAVSHVNAWRKPDSQTIESVRGAARQSLDRNREN